MFSKVVMSKALPVVASPAVVLMDTEALPLAAFWTMVLLIEAL